MDGRLRRRAQIGVQFNWIFILIAGAVILGFFFTVIQKQRSISSQKVSLSLVNDFETIAVGALQAKDTVQTIELPSIDIEFTCTEECTCSFSIGEVNRDYKEKIIFSPRRIESSELAVWTLDWNLPFRITNFLYLTDRNVMHFLIYEQGNAQSERLLDLIVRRLPDEILYQEIELTDLPAARNENYNKAKFVFLATGEEHISEIDTDEFEDANPSALAVTPDKNLIFYSPQGRSQEFTDIKETYYTTLEGLLGAIFSENYHTYECNMRKAFVRAQYVSQIYEARMQSLGQDPNLQAQGCAYQTGEGTDIRSIQEQARLMRNGLQPLASLAGAASRLEEANQNLLRKSCPTIY